MERDPCADRERTSVFPIFLLGAVLGVIAVFLYWLQRSTEPQVIEHEPAMDLRVQVSPPPSEAEPDDLTRIEGIGPKLATVLRSSGVSTYERLATSTVDDLRAILRERRLYFTDPSTWPEQAELAAAGAWDALSDLQEELTAGRRS